MKPKCINRTYPELENEDAGTLFHVARRLHFLPTSHSEKSNRSKRPVVISIPKLKGPIRPERAIP